MNPMRRAESRFSVHAKQLSDLQASKLLIHDRVTRRLCV